MDENGGNETDATDGTGVDTGTDPSTRDERNSTTTDAGDVTAVDDAFDTIEEDTPTSLDVLANDSAEGGFAVLVNRITDDPRNGTATLQSSGEILYAPDENFVGSDSFTYRAISALGDTADATVTITVTPVNDVPVALDDDANAREDETVRIDALANDSDADGDPLSPTVTAAPSNGTVAFEDGGFVYTPNENYFGDDAFSYTVSDGTATSEPATVSITVRAINDAPVAADDTATTDEDTPVTIDVLANDSDAENTPLEVTRVTDGANGSVSLDGGIVTYTPDADFNGEDSFTYQIVDEEGSRETGTVSVTVAAVNDAPTAEPDTATTDEDTAVTVAVLGNDGDVDGDDLTVTIESGPASGDAGVTPDGEIIYTPAADFNGSDTITYQVADGSGGTAESTLTITVDPVNDAPVIEPGPLATTTAEDTALAIDASSVVTDIDSPAENLRFEVDSRAANGRVTIDDDTGAFVYTPNENFFGEDSFTYTVDDRSRGTATGEVSITVTSVNDLPVTEDDRVVTDEDTEIVIDALANDSDIESETLSLGTITVEPENGTVVANEDGTLTYRPNENFFGDDSFTYEAVDADGGRTEGSVAVQIRSVNDLPVVGDDTATTAEDTAVSIVVLANDSDVEGGDVRIADVGRPENGRAEIVRGEAGEDGEEPGPTTILYTPDENFNGTDTFTYVYQDADGAEATATVSVEVTPVNDAPVANPDRAQTLEEVLISIPVTENDEDLDGDALQVGSISVGPANGSAEISADGTAIEYTPALDFNGEDSITYIVTDGDLTSETTVAITVDPVNDLPVFSGGESITATTDEDTTVEINLAALFSDVDGDSLRFELEQEPTAGRVRIDGSDGIAVYTPDDDVSGEDSFSFSVNDRNGGEITGNQVSITVNPVNDAPVTETDTATGLEDEPLTIDVLANDSDPDDGDTLSLAGVQAGENGTAEIVEGEVVYTPNENFNGSDLVTYTTSDGEGLETTGEIRINLDNVNDAPEANDDLVETARSKKIKIKPLENDSDPDGDRLKLELSGDPANGSIKIKKNKIIYKRDKDNESGDEFNYLVLDREGGVDTATVTIRFDGAPVPEVPGEEAPGDDPAVTDDPPAEDEPLVVENDADDEGGPSEPLTDGETGPVTDSAGPDLEALVVAG